MEEEKINRDTPDLKCPRKLNFNVPLLSTRRVGSSTATQFSSQSASWRTSDRIPFSWEQAPGKPKESDRNYNDMITEEDITPRPSLPPGWWRPPIEATINGHHHRPCSHRDRDDDDGCEGDLDHSNIHSNDNGNDDSDDMDVFSLSEAIDIVEKADRKVHKFDSLLKLKLDEIPSEDQSPNFMIERFLPDATAVAALSTLNLSKNTNRETRVSRPVRRSSSSIKGCGLDSLFPWRMKHKLCGIKSPVIRQASLNLQPQSITKQKKP